MIINQFKQKCINMDNAVISRITDLKSDNSSFGLFQIGLIKKVRNLEKGDSNSESSIVTEDSTVSDCSSEGIKDSYSSDESDTLFSSKKEKVIEVVNSKLYFLKNSKFKRVFLKNKKIPKTQKECNYFVGGTVSEFTKDSPFINMLINRRIRFCDLGPSCHIAAFIPHLGIENKFSNWAFGKFAIGENSERFRFGNTRLSTHAEMDALKKLDNLIRVQKCKKQRMDLVVIRVNKSGNLCESAPCYHCTRELASSKVVTINKLYFSRWDGTITCVKFTEWLKNDNFHISKGWRWMADTCYSK